MPRRSERQDPASSVDEVVDRLYALEPESFTTERNGVAKGLRADGDREGSDVVKALKRPTVAAWAVNQLGRRRPDLVAELLAAGADLRSAQRAALSGSGRGKLQEASQRRRAAVAALLDEAASLFQETGRSPAPHVDAIRSTLEAASTDEATAELVRAGRLTKEVEPLSGFGDISPFEVLAGGRSAPKGDAAMDEEAAASPAARRLRERLEARVAKAEDALATAREAATEARGEASAAAKEADRLERELQTARRRAERADKAATAAEAKAEQSEQALTKAQADLDEES